MNYEELLKVTHNNSREAGIAEERARIIKLLESDPEELIEAGGGLRAGYEIAIELIKGQ